MIGAIGFAASGIMRGPMKTMADVSQRSQAEADIMSNMQLTILGVADMSDQDCDKDGTVEPPGWTAGTGPTNGGLVPSTAIRTSNATDPWGTTYGYCVWDHGTKVEGDTALGGECASGPTRLEGIDLTQHAGGSVQNQVVIAYVSAGADRTFQTVCRNWGDADVDSGSENGSLADANDLPLITRGGDDIVMSFTYGEASVATSSKWKLKSETGDTTGNTVAELDQAAVELGGDTMQVGTSGTDTGQMSFSDGTTVGGLVLPRDPGDDSVTGACVDGGTNDLQLRFNTSTSPSTLEICDDGSWQSLGGGQSATGNCTAYIPNGVDFDGTNDYLTYAADLDGTSDTKQLTLSFWAKRGAIGSQQDIIHNSLDDFHVYFTAANALNIDMSDGGTTSSLSLSEAEFANTTDWFHVAVSIDLSTQTALAYVNGSVVTPAVETLADHTIDITGGTYGFFSSATGTNKFNGEVADFYFDLGTAVDFSSVSTLEKFIVSDGPAYLGPKGQIPTGTAPVVFLSGVTEKWHGNTGTGGALTKNGALGPSTEVTNGYNCTSEMTGRGYCSAYTPTPVDTKTGTNNFVTRGADLTNVSDADKISFSFWVKRTGSYGSSNDIIATNGAGFRVVFGAGNRLFILAENSSSSPVVNVSTSTGYTDSSWHHVLGSIDTDNGVYSLYIDDSAPGMTGTSVSSSETIDVTKGNFVVGAGTAAGGNPLDGQLADVWIDIGAYIDFSLEANRRKFITEFGAPVYLGDNGSQASGSIPEVFLSGAVQGWENNKGSGGGFTENNTLVLGNWDIPEGDNCNFVGSGDMASNLAQYWPLDSSAPQETQTDNDGTLSGGATLTTGIDGGSIEFTGNGTSSSVDLSDISPLDATQPYTVSAWVKPDSMSATNTSYTIYTLGRNAGANNYVRFDLGVYADNNSLKPVVSTYSGSWTDLAGSRDLNTDQWQMVTFVYDGTNMNIYINGLLDTSSAYTTPALSTAVVNGSIGYEGNASDAYTFDGKIDDVRVYQRAMTAEDVSQLYSSYSGIEAGLIQYWPLDDVDGSSVTPENMTGNEGTLAGTTASSAAGKIGNAVDFTGTGTDARINLDSISSFNATQDYTISAWVYPDTDPAAGKEYVIYSPMINNANRYVYFGLSEDLEPTATTYQDAGGSSTAMTADTALIPGMWQHVSYVFDGTNINFYINGELDTSASYTDPYISAALNAGTLGYVGSASDDKTFDGRIDELRVYQRALGPSEIATLYKWDGGETASSYDQGIVENFTAEQSYTQDSAADDTLATHGTIISNLKDANGVEAAIGILIMDTPADGEVTGAGLAAVREGPNGRTGFAFKTQNSAGDYQPRGYLDGDGDLGLGVNAPSDMLAKIQIRDVDFKDGLWGYWKLDETSGGNGAVAYDSSRYGRDGTYTNFGPDTLSASAIMNTGTDFETGGAAYITRSLAADESCDDLKEVTVSAWVNFGTYDGGYETVLEIEDLLSVRSQSNSQGIDVRADGWGTYGQWTTDTTDGPAASTWGHIAVTYNYNEGIDADPKIYVNGSEVEINAEDQTPAGGFTSSCAGTVQIAKHTYDGSGYLDGQIDDVRIYNRVLDGDEILDIALARSAQSDYRRGLLVKGDVEGGATTLETTSDLEYNTVINAGWRHSCGIQADGTAWCWGNDGNGMLGNDTDGDTTVPDQVSDAGPWRSITVNDSHSCGIKTDGTAWCWGSDSAGGIGDGLPTAAQANPTQVDDAGPWASIENGYLYSCGLQTDGTAWCWGRNLDGQLGNSAAANSEYSPVEVDGDGPWVRITAGGSHSCGIKADGTAWCWGDDTNGQLGNGSATTGDQSSPVQVDDNGPWVAISAGNNFTCGLKADRTAWCWGTDANGELGNGAAVSADQSSPYQMDDAGPWSDISAGEGYACGLKTDGTAWCWGSDSAYRLGNGADGNQSSADQVSDAGPWASITAGSYAITCGIKTNGSGYCWGRDYFGALGISGSGSKADPEPLADAGPWSAETSNAYLYFGENAGAYFGAEGIEDAATTIVFGSKLIIGDTDTDGSTVTEMMRLDISGLTTFSTDFTALVDSDMTAWSQSSSASDSVKIKLQRATGSEASPTDVSDGDIIGAIKFLSRSGGSLPSDSHAAIYAAINGTVSSNTVPADLYFSVDSAGSATGSSDFAILSDGKVAVGATSATNELHVEGRAKFDKGYRFGEDATCATGADDGVIAYDGAGGLEFCASGGTTGLTSSANLTGSDENESAKVAYGWGAGAAYKLQNFVTTSANVSTPMLTANIYGVKKITSQGGAASCALNNQGEIWCWGDETSGGLGNGSTGGTQQRPIIVDHPDGLRWIDYDNHVGGICAIDAARDMYCWGEGSAGEMGDGASSDNTTPDIVGAIGTYEWASVGSGRLNVCAVTTDGTGYCWGAGSNGQIGNGASATVNTPQAVSGGHTWDHIDAGEYITCGVTTDGDGYCWGRNEEGGVGNGAGTGDYDTPQLLGVGIKWDHISVGRDVCGVTVDNTMLCWGRLADNFAGLGNDIIAERPWPVPMGAGIKWEKVYAGYNNDCAISIEGKIYCWGDSNTLLGMGVTSPGDQTYPQEIVNDLRFSDVTVGFANVFGVTDPDKSKISYATGWGDDTGYQIGNDDTAADATVPKLVWGQNDWIKLARGEDHSCGIDMNQDLYCWGTNGAGQLGINNTTTEEAPTQENLGLKWLDVTAANEITCAIDTKRDAYCWGDNTGVSGRIGDGTTGSDRDEPTKVIGGHKWVQIDAGDQVVCGVVSNGDGYCWGTELTAEAGNGSGDTDTLDEPTIVADSHKWQKILTNVGPESTTCGLDTSGAAWCWGKDATYGSVGDGGGASATASQSPVAVAGSFVFTDIGGGGPYCGIDENQDAYCWGRNTSGELGIGSTGGTNDEPATAVTGSHKWVKIEGGDSYMCGLTSEDRVYCWGEGDNYRLGNGATSDQSNPTLVFTADTKVADLFAGPLGGFAVFNDFETSWSDCAAGELEFNDLYTSTSSDTLTTDTIEITGVDGTCTLSILSESPTATLYLNTVAQTETMITVENGDEVYLEIDSPNTVGESYTTYVMLGNHKSDQVTTTDKKIFFQRRDGWNGALGGISGADALCQLSAEEGELDGQFLAWIADDTAYPAARFSHWNHEYVLVNGTKIADDWEDLTDSSIDNIACYDEYGVMTAGCSQARTNVAGDGTPVGVAASDHCANWSSGIPATGNVGRSTAFYINSQGWTHYANGSCGSASPRMYCFEQ